MSAERPTHASQVRHPWPLRLWWAVRPAVAWTVSVLAVLAAGALLVLAALGG